MWQQIANDMGINEPTNGSWIQAICESLGIMQPINGSWIQALAEQGIPTGGGNEMIENTATIDDFQIFSFDPGAGPKGTDLFTFGFRVNSNSLIEDNYLTLLVSNYDYGFYVVELDNNTKTLVTPGKFGSSTYLYFENYAENGSFVYTVDLQFFNNQTGVISEIISVDLNVLGI